MKSTKIYESFVCGTHVLYDECFLIQPGSASKEVSYFSIWREHTHLKDEAIVTFKMDVMKVKAAMINLFASKLKGQESFMVLRR